MSRAIYISPAQAASLMGVSERSIRRAIKNKEIQTFVRQARYKIELEELINWSDKLPNRQKKRDSEGMGQYVEKWKI